MQKSRWIVVGLIAFVLVGLLSLGVGVAEPVNVELILDASGSMAAKVDGRQKMAIAKDVVTSFAGTLPANAQVAVRTYGHHREEDCADLERLAHV